MDQDDVKDFLGDIEENYNRGQLDGTMSGALVKKISDPHVAKLQAFWDQLTNDPFFSKNLNKGVRNEGTIVGELFSSFVTWLVEHEGMDETGDTLLALLCRMDDIAKFFYGKLDAWDLEHRAMKDYDIKLKAKINESVLRKADSVPDYVHPEVRKHNNEELQLLLAKIKTLPENDPQLPALQKRVRLLSPVSKLNNGATRVAEDQSLWYNVFEFIKAQFGGSLDAALQMLEDYKAQSSQQGPQDGQQSLEQTAGLVDTAKAWALATLLGAAMGISPQEVLATDMSNLHNYVSQAAYGNQIGQKEKQKDYTDVDWASTDIKAHRKSIKELMGNGAQHGTKAIKTSDGTFLIIVHVAGVRNKSLAFDALDLRAEKAAEKLFGSGYVLRLDCFADNSNNDNSLYGVYGNGR